MSRLRHGRQFQRWTEFNVSRRNNHLFGAAATATRGVQLWDIVSVTRSNENGGKSLQFWQIVTRETWIRETLFHVKKLSPEMDPTTKIYTANPSLRYVILWSCIYNCRVGVDRAERKRRGAQVQCLVPAVEVLIYWPDRFNLTHFLGQFAGCFVCIKVVYFFRLDGRDFLSKSF